MDWCGRCRSAPPRSAALPQKARSRPLGSSIVARLARIIFRPSRLRSASECSGECTRRTACSTSARHGCAKRASKSATLGADVLLDTLLLSRANFLLKGTSAVAEFALYFNPALAANTLDLELTDHGPRPKW